MQIGEVLFKLSSGPALKTLISELNGGHTVRLNNRRVWMPEIAIIKGRLI